MYSKHTTHRDTTRLCIAILLSLTLSSAQRLRGETFDEDVAFLREHLENVIVLGEGSAQVAVTPTLQGRIMTSTLAGKSGLSLGWMNRKLIASGELQEHINAFGGEDRIWLGPEGGQYSIFFPAGAEFTLDNWQTPAPIDSEPYAVVAREDDRVEFRHAMQLKNYSGTQFQLRLDRVVRLLDRAAVEKTLDVELPSNVTMVAFASENKITNTGQNTWTKASGLLSLWILGMFPPSDQTTIVAPIKPGPESELGPRVNTNYFGDIPSSRIRTTEDAVFFSGDGKFRSKFGITPQRARPVLGSYDAAENILTVVEFTLPPRATDYVNSSWELQEHPYGGDVSNSYNDGPPAPGAAQLGPFYELESSSPAAALAPGESLQHVHRTIHLTGDRQALSDLARNVLGKTLPEIETALTP